MNRLVRKQRDILVGVLESLSDEQWAAETLCEGWDAGDIAAHLIVREREPIAAMGILLPPLQWLHERRMAARKAKGRHHLLETLRQGPTPWMTLGPGAGVQLGEDWIHTEDVRRGGAGLDGDDGTADAGIAKALWQAVSRYAPLTLRRIDRDGVVSFTDGTTSRIYHVGGRVARPEPDAAHVDVTVTGPVGELVLFVTGRRAARVDIDGDAELVSEMQGADKGV